MGEEIKVIVFKLGEEEYGVEVEKVQSIERMVPITRVPRTYDFVKGVFNMRGVVIPVIDLRGSLDYQKLNIPIKHVLLSLLWARCKSALSWIQRMMLLT